MAMPLSENPVCESNLKVLTWTFVIIPSITFPLTISSVFTFIYKDHQPTINADCSVSVFVLTLIYLFTAFIIEDLVYNFSRSIHDRVAVHCNDLHFRQVIHHIHAHVETIGGTFAKTPK